MVLSPKFAAAAASFVGINRTLLANDGAPTSAATSGRGELSSDPLASWQVALQSGSLAVVCVLSVVGNFLVAFTLVKKDQLLLPSNRLVFSLTGANFVFSVLVLPFVVASVAEQKWLFGIFWCNFTAFLTVLFGIASILTLAAIAIDRYYAIVKPMMYTMTITTSKSTAMLLWVWVQACICSLPPLFGWSRFEYVSSKAVCAVDWSASATYTAFFLSACVLLPFSVMATCYYHILQVARTKCRKIHVGTVTTPTTQAPPTTTTTVPSEPTVAPPSGCPRLQPKVHRLSLPKRPSWVLLSYNSMAKGVRTICVVVGAFLLTWLPYIVMAAAEAACGGASSNPVATSCVPRWYGVLATWLMYASTVGYPVVYGLYNRSIRKEMRAGLCPGGGRGAGSSTKGLPQRRSSLRRLSFSGSLLEYSPFRAKPQLPGSRRASGELGVARAASVDLTVGAGDQLAAQAASLRKASQDSGAIMTESDLDTDLSFLPGYWFGRHSATAAAKLQQLHHRLSSRLRDRSGTGQQQQHPATTAASGERRPSSPTPADDDPALIRRDPALIRHDPSADLHCQVTVHMGMDEEVGVRTGGCRSGDIPSIPSVEAAGSEARRDRGTGNEVEEVTFAFRAKHRAGLGCRGESIDEGIVNDCILEDVD